MSQLKLKTYRKKSIKFEDFQRNPMQSDNIFILSHLGQLKQMEALIQSKGLTSNCLVVLYTLKNLVVPNNVNNSYSEDCFDNVIFFEIPFGASKLHYQQLNLVKRNYQKLLKAINGNSLYCNSFEGHYAVLMSLAKSRKMETILVEEGTATYKLNVSETPYNSADMSFLNNVFHETIGSTYVFKKLVELNAINHELLTQSKSFIEKVKKNENFQKKLIEMVGNQHIKSALKPFKDFNKAYASFPNLLKKSFKVDNIDYFMIHDFISQEALSKAEEVVESYNISSKDILYVSQRYTLDSEDYVRAVVAILSRMMKGDQKVFIKLHPKESQKIHDSFKYMEFVSNGKFTVIEDNQFLIESVIKVSGIRSVVGLTSTTLVYAPLVSSKSNSISIAEELIALLSSNKANTVGIKTILEHLQILKIFENIEFN